MSAPPSATMFPSGSVSLGFFGRGKMIRSSASAWLLASTYAAAHAPSFPVRGTIESPATAPHRVTRRISDKLTLTLSPSVDADGVWSWDVAVRNSKDGENLLYESRYWHGPHPSMVDAWAVRDHYFPASNELSVRGYPWRVSIACVACKEDGVRTKEHFVSGTISVAGEAARR
jgi:hypothetical protein